MQTAHTSCDGRCRTGREPTGTEQLMLRRMILAFAMVAVLGVASSARADVPNPRSRAFPRDAHWCRGGDPPLDASRSTSCVLAAGVVNRLFNGPMLTTGRMRTMSVKSALWSRPYQLQLTRRGNYVTVTGPSEIWIRFYYDG